MAFPIVAGYGGGTSGGDVTQSNVDLSAAGIPEVDDLLVVMFVKDGSGAITWAAGWNVLRTSQLFSVAGQYALATRVVQVGDPTTIAVTHALETSAWNIYRIQKHFGTQDANTVANTVSTASTSSPNAPLLDPANWGTADTLWITGVAHDNGNVQATSPPTSFTNLIGYRYAAASGVGMSSARLENAVSSYDPDTFTLSAVEEVCVTTVAIRPGNVGGGIVGTVSFTVDM